MTDVEKKYVKIDLQFLLKDIKILENHYSERVEKNKDDYAYRQTLSTLQLITNSGAYQRLQQLIENGKL